MKKEDILAVFSTITAVFVLVQFKQIAQLKAKVVELENRKTPTAS